MKTLKTTCALDLAISLATQTPFLGYFVVPQKVRVAVLSGESGIATLQETASRISKAKGIKLADADVLWQTDLPRLSDAGDREQLRDGLAAYAVKVVIIDPLYLCLLGGEERASPSNMYEVGPLLFRAANACLQAGATPVLVHHATKSAKRNSDHLDLDDLAWSGIGEFARQWLLLNRREPFEPGAGHALNLAIGGSAGQSARWRLDINEGMVRSGRCWEVKVYPG